MLFSRDEKLLLALLGAINFSHIVDFMILMPLGPVLTRLFGLSVREFGLLISSYAFAAALSGVLVSFFVDRFDRKWSLLFFLAGFFLSTLACAFAADYPGLLLARTLSGAFGGVLSSMVLSIVSDSFAYERRGTAMGTVMGAFSLASILGVPFSLLLAERFGWHAPFLFLALSSGLVGLLAAGCLRPMRGHLGKRRRSPAELLRMVGSSSPQRWALLLLCCLFFGQFLVVPFLSQSCVYNGGLPESQLFAIYFFGGICSLIGSPLSGRLSDRFGKHETFMVFALLSLVPTFLVTQLQASPVPALIAISSGFFFVTAARMVPAMALVSSTASPEIRGGFMSLCSALQQVAMSVSSYFASVIVVKVEGRFQNYDLAGWVSMAFSVLAVLLCRRIPRGRQ